MPDSDIFVRGGRAWFSWAILAGVAVVAASGAGVYFTVSAGQADVAKRLATNEAAVAKVTETLGSIADDMQAIRSDVADALSDRWTATDMRFLWARLGIFWSEFQRLNPTVQVPQWPPADRATTNERETR